MGGQQAANLEEVPISRGFLVASPAGLEPATCGLEIRCCYPAELRGRGGTLVAQEEAAAPAARAGPAARIASPARATRGGPSPDRNRGLATRENVEAAARVR